MNSNMKQDKQEDEELRFKPDPAEDEQNKKSKL
jgi:hypothetical protein